jgi:hypothetical protein
MMKKITPLILKIMIIRQLKNNKTNYSQSFSLAFIFSYLDINISENASTLTNYSFSVFLVFLLSLIFIAPFYKGIRLRFKKENVKINILNLKELLIILRGICYYWSFNMFYLSPPLRGYVNNIFHIFHFICLSRY